MTDHPTPLNPAAALDVLTDLHKDLVPVLDPRRAAQVMAAIAALNAHIDHDGTRAWRHADGRTTTSMKITADLTETRAHVERGEWFIARTGYGTHTILLDRADADPHDVILDAATATALIDEELAQPR